MVNFLRASAVVAALLLSLPAWAADGWYRNTAGTGGSPTHLFTALGGGVQEAFFLISDTALAGDLSNVLQTDDAESLEFTLVTDLNGTAGTCEVTLFESYAAGGITPTTVTALPELSPDTTTGRCVPRFMAHSVIVRVDVPPGAGEQCAFKIQGKR